MPGLRKTEDYYSIKTRLINVQNTDGTFPPPNSVLTTKDDLGHTAWSQDLSLNAVSLVGPNGEIMLTTDGTQLLVDGSPVGGGGGGGVTSVKDISGGGVITDTSGSVVTVRSALVPGVGIDIAYSLIDQAQTIDNTGVTQITAGSGISVSSGGTGNVTVAALVGPTRAIFVTGYTNLSTNITDISLCSLTPSVTGIVCVTTTISIRFATFGFITLSLTVNSVITTESFKYVQQFPDTNVYHTIPLSCSASCTANTLVNINLIINCNGSIFPVNVTRGPVTGFAFCMGT